jgi:uncharacterized caspase-like protein
MPRRRENRVAFVLGNEAYSGENYLPNPVRDAKAMEVSLNRLGFNVTANFNLGFAQTKIFIDEFIERLRIHPADVGLLYYSGHGIQINDENYLVPIDVKLSETTDAQLIRLKEIIEGISEHCAVRLIILDACRDNPLAPDIVKSALKTRGLYLGNGEIKTSGLAEVKAAANTFIAFAAAPGDVAYDGEGELSPFTQALVDNIAAVDLPLSNLSIRVRNEVGRLTQGLQKTWDHSSLGAPFFFNPGSLLLLTGNSLSFMALMATFYTYSMILASDAGARWIMGGGVLVAIALSILLAGMQRAYKRLRGEFDPGDPGKPRLGVFLGNIVRKGIFGGFIGAVVAAPLVAVPFHGLWKVTAADWRASGMTCGGTPPIVDPLGTLLLEISVTSIVTSVLLGTLCLAASGLILGSNGLCVIREPTRQRLLIGSLVGGVLAGIITGPGVMIYFARLCRPILQPEYLMPGAIIGAAFIAFAVVNYNLERFSLARLGASAIAALAAGVCGVIAGGLIFGALYWVGFVDHIIGWISDELTLQSFILGGIAYGVPVGIVLGLIIALTQIFTPGEATVTKS